MACWSWGHMLQAIGGELESVDPNSKVRWRVTISTAYWKLEAKGNRERQTISSFAS